MIVTGPRFRASHTRGTVLALKRLAPDALERVLARLGPEVRAGLGEALRGDFIPASWDLALVQAIRAELGQSGTRAVMRDMMKASLGGSLLGGLLRSAQALFGRSPAGILRWAGHAYAHVTRDCGRCTLEAVAEGTALLRLEGMPAALVVPHYLDAIAGAIEALFDVSRVAGSVTLWDVASDGARFQVSWRAPR